MKKDKFIVKLMAETKWYFVAVIISAVIAMFYKNYAFVGFELLLLGGMIFYHITRRNLCRQSFHGFQ